MQLHRNQVPTLSRNMTKALVDSGAIEVADGREVERDLEAVLHGYLAQVEQALTRARELAQQRGLPQGEFGRIKQLAAEQVGVKVGDEALDYLLDQLLEMLMHSGNVAEVYAPDHELKRCLRPFIQAGAEVEHQVEQEVRSQLKHVEEGSRTWEIEYARMKADIKRRRGL
jgi:hypothetical protein